MMIGLTSNMVKTPSLHVMVLNIYMLVLQKEDFIKLGNIMLTRLERLYVFYTKEQ